MFRIVLTYLVLFFLPFLLYALLLYIKRRTGVEVERHPIAWLVVAGFLIAIVGGALIGLLDGSKAGSAYTPAVLQNGKIVPGRFQ